MGSLINTVLPPDLVISIRPRSSWGKLGLRELWEFRELLYFLTWRDIKVRYKRTLIGILWAVIQPFFTMIVFSVLFGRLVGVQSDGLPYPVFAYAALVPWMFFANGVTAATNAVVANSRMITKVYFPRLLLPMSSILATFFDMGIALLVLFGMLLVYGLPFHSGVFALPIFIGLAILVVLAVGVWLSALNALYQDVRYAIPFVIQLWLFASPVAYSSSVVPEEWRMFYGLNPMTGVIEGFRWALLGTSVQPGPIILVSVAVTCVLLIGGVMFFRHLEPTFADVV